MKTALIAGGSGLVGHHCLSFLLERSDYGRTVALVRKPLNRADPTLLQQVVDFNDLEEATANLRAQLQMTVRARLVPSPLEVLTNPTLTHSNLINEHLINDAFCCLGTTMKNAGSKAAFRQVDFDYIVQFAKWSRSLGAQRFFLVSALGANAQSPLYYNRIKGETENAVKALGFTQAFIFRPSLLLGERKEFRLAEKIALFLSSKVLKPSARLPLGPLRKFCPIEARDVARAMVKVAQGNFSADHIIESAEIQRLADGETT